MLKQREGGRVAYSLNTNLGPDKSRVDITL